MLKQNRDTKSRCPPDLKRRAHLWAVKPPQTKEWVLQSLMANHKPKNLAKSCGFEAEIRHLLFKTHRWQFVGRNTGGQEQNAQVSAVSPRPSGKARCAASQVAGSQVAREEQSLCGRRVESMAHPPLPTCQAARSPWPG